jgi:hypothetical protein
MLEEEKNLASHNSKVTPNGGHVVAQFVVHPLHREYYAEYVLFFVYKEL